MMKGGSAAGHFLYRRWWRPPSKSVVMKGLPFFCIAFPLKRAGIQIIFASLCSRTSLAISFPQQMAARTLVFIRRYGQNLPYRMVKCQKSHFTFFHCRCNGMGKVGIVNRILAVGAKVFKNNPFPSGKRWGLLYNHTRHDRCQHRWVCLNQKECINSCLGQNRYWI